MMNRHAKWSSRMAIRFVLDNKLKSVCHLHYDPPQYCDARREN